MKKICVAVSLGMAEGLLQDILHVDPEIRMDCSVHSTVNSDFDDLSHFGVCVGRGRSTLKFRFSDKDFKLEDYQMVTPKVFVEEISGTAVSKEA